MTRSDRDVVRAIRRGDREAFAELIQRYQVRLYGLALMMVRDRAAAEEVAQDAFVRACTHIDRFDDRQPFYPWLATIAVRLAQTLLRRRGQMMRREGTPLDDCVEAPAASADALAALIADERGRRLWRAVAALPSGQRTAVVLYYRDEMPVRDIARALGVSTGTIKTLLFRARRRLRTRLEAADLPEEARST